MSRVTRTLAPGAPGRAPIAEPRDDIVEAREILEAVRHGLQHGVGVAGQEVRLDGEADLLGASRNLGGLQPLDHIEPSARQARLAEIGSSAPYRRLRLMPRSPTAMPAIQSR